MDNITLFGEDKELKSVGASHSGEAHEEELTMYNAVVKLTPRVAPYRDWEYHLYRFRI